MLDVANYRSWDFILYLSLAKSWSSLCSPKMIKMEIFTILVTNFFLFASKNKIHQIS